ncbi:AAA family ATPase [Chloroflexi bacterium TSY]|nr:AAA family ATPase [Chloroflexi bacterium TSY]
MTLQIKLFGHLKIIHDETTVQQLRPRAKRLFAYLLLNRRAFLTRERIAPVLWPDTTETECRSILSRALNELRKVLPASEKDEWIISTRQDLHWNPSGPYALDVAEFEHLVRQDTVLSLEKSLDIYTGDLLPELDDDWVVAERNRLQQVYSQTLEKLMTHYWAHEAFDQAINLAQRQLTFDPLSEATYRDLMRLYYLSGDRAAALTTYEAAKTILRQEIEVEPMAETQELAMAISEGLSVSTVITSPLDPTPERAKTLNSNQDLVGRTIEMDSLRSLWTNVAAGEGACALIGGQAGVGKSHLIQSFTQSLKQQGVWILTGTCHEYEQVLAYQTLATVLRPAAGQLQQSDLEPTYRFWLRHLLPDIWFESSENLTGTLSDSQEHSHLKLFEVLTQAVKALGRLQPFVMVLEDLQWASTDTLDWLTYLLDQMSQIPLLLVVTYQLEEIDAHHPISRLQYRYANHQTVLSFSLNPLSQADCQTFVMRLSGLQGTQVRSVADRLFRESGGNPRVLQEIIHSLIEADQIYVNNQGFWSGPFLSEVEKIEIPISYPLQTLFTTLTRQLTPTSQHILQAATVAGLEFDYRQVQQAGDWSEEAFLDAMEELYLYGLIYEGQRDYRFAFTYPLFHQVIYTGLFPPRRHYWQNRLMAHSQD